MKLLLEKSEKEKFFFNALCNGLHYYFKKQIEVAKRKLLTFKSE